MKITRIWDASDVHPGVKAYFDGVIFTICTKGTEEFWSRKFSDLEYVLTSGNRVSEEWRTQTQMAEFLTEKNAERVK
jgi:hypothetical protein